jgi:hypothetical protein
MMNPVKLTISTTPGLIGIRTTPGKLNIETSPARLDMHQEFHAVSIETTRPILEISQYAPMAQMGYKRVSDSVIEMARRGMQSALEYIAAKTDEGTRLKAIEKGGNPIREIAIEKAWPEKQRQGHFIPVTGPKYHAVPGEVKIMPPHVKNPAHIGYEAEYIPGRLNIQYSPGNVEVYMRQYPEIKFDVSI